MSDETPIPRRESLTENWISLSGFVLAIVFLVGEALVIAIDLYHGTTNPYVGILIYIVGPSILVTGLLLVPFGMWLEHRRRKRSLPERFMPVIDLNVRSHRLKAGIFLAVSTVFIVLSLVGTYQAYHVTESTEFCGTTCHEVMHPEYTAYQDSPHANVGCTGCHIGAGADWYVKSKLSGARQVFKTALGTYELPIETPIENLVPARYTCEECHWPRKFYDSVEQRRVYYGSDEENTPYEVSLLLHIGPESGPEEAGHIHWHIGLDHTLEFYAADKKRQKIPWVRVTYDDGRVIEYVDEEAGDFDPAAMEASQLEVMDCIDCHNRPSHRYKSPFRATNEAMRFGRIDPRIPGIKANVVEALQGEYASQGEALEAIDRKLRETYAEALGDPGSRTAVERAIGSAKEIYRKNFFPEWGVDWSLHPWNVGHFHFPGCYRCHDGKHRSTDGARVIRHDCDLCHSIVRQGEGWEAVRDLDYEAQEFSHPRGFGDLWEGQNCHECHGPGMM